ncbi:MAG TPA: hypothetical protein DIT03_17710 [Candidatus Accumulibacter sp.]|nr:hypothetical protein [Accumulibacter sp.]HCN70029.1 hypothetical protein [Accumulibacter sp.]
MLRYQPLIGSCSRICSATRVWATCRCSARTARQ